MTDEFGLRAGNALIALAESDARAAVGYANRALHHPHRSVRLEALRQMAQLGPAAADAIPELMRIASQDDAAMALEALKLLGMAGKDVGKHMVAIDSLASNGKGPAARVAKGLAARLRAMGCESMVADLEAQALEAKLAKLNEALDESPNEDLVITAIENWTLSGPEDQAVVAKLTDIASDKRRSVAKAAKAALARLQAK